MVKQFDNYAYLETFMYSQTHLHIFINEETMQEMWEANGLYKEKYSRLHRQMVTCKDHTDSTCLKV